MRYIILYWHMLSFSRAQTCGIYYVLNLTSKAKQFFVKYNKYFRKKFQKENISVCLPVEASYCNMVIFLVRLLSLAKKVIPIKNFYTEVISELYHISGVITSVIWPSEK